MQIVDEPLVGGLTVRALLAPSGRTAVVVYDPAKAFACTTDLAFWNDLRVKAPERLVLLVVSPARADDVRAMALAGFTPRGVLTASGSGAERLVGTYIVENGVVVARATDVMEVARRRLWNHVLPGTSDREPRTM